MANYDIVGNIAIVKFIRGTLLGDKKRFAKEFLLLHKGVRTVLEKSDKIKGRLRKQKTGYILGERAKEALYRENGCVFRFHVDRCYFSPRLAAERLLISKLVRKGEHVLVMFGGVAPYAIVIAKHSGAVHVVSVELGKECTRYALENVKRNKVDDRVVIVQGDVRKKVPLLKKKFDRIVMARPNLKDSFLDVAFRAVKRGGVIHYYGFYKDNEKDVLKALIEREASRAKKKIRILRIRRAGDIGPYMYRWRVGIRVSN